MTPREYIESRLEAHQLVKHYYLYFDYFKYAPDGENYFTVFCFDDDNSADLKCLLIYPEKISSLYKKFVYHKDKDGDLHYFLKCKCDAAFAMCQI